MLNKIKKFFEAKVNMESRNVEEVSAQAGITVKDDFQKITAKQIAEDNGIEYIAKAERVGWFSKRRGVIKLFARKGKYILLYPANDGMPTWPIEWWGIWKENYQMIMDNQDSFKGITNLGEILL